MDSQDWELRFAMAINDAVNDAIDEGVAESRAFAARVATHPKVKEFIKQAAQARTNPRAPAE
jgi:hypothetical protein